MQQFGYERHKFYGKLAQFSQPQIAALVAALIEQKYLRIVGGELPVLALSPWGNQALEARAALPIDLPELMLESQPVKQWQSGANRSNTVMQTLELFQQGLSPAEIATRRELTINTIFGHLARLIGDDKIELQQVIAPAVETQVLAAIDRVGSTARLTPIKAQLPDEISFDQIKCVLAGHPELASENRGTKSGDGLIDRIVSLGETGDPNAVQEIVEALSHQSGNVRRLAASALGKIGDQSAVEPLIDLLKRETKPQVRQYTIKALGNIGDVRTISILEKIATDTNEKDYNQKASQFALEKLYKLKKEGRQEQASPTQSPHLPVSQSPKPPISPSPTTLILEAVAKLGGTLGRTGLAQFLTGSQAAWLESFADHSYYGQLTDFSQKAVLNIIDALITEGQLQTTGGNRPKVILPSQNLHSEAVSAATPDEVETDHSMTSNEEAVAETTVDSPEPVGERPSSTEPSAAPTDATDQPAADPTLLEALQTWRTEQARSQGVPPFFIFPNKVLTAIAAQQPTSLAALGAISGIGPAKLEQYGETVLTIVADPSAPSAPAPPAGESDLEIREAKPPLEPTNELPADETASPDIEKSVSESQDPMAAILAVVADLEGLLTPEALARLLTAAPDEVVPFSDHELCGVLHQRWDVAQIQALIEERREAKHLILSRNGRLMLP